jgi:chromosome segregation ATPase
MSATGIIWIVLSTVSNVVLWMKLRAQKDNAVAQMLAGLQQTTIRNLADLQSKDAERQRRIEELLVQLHTLQRNHDKVLAELDDLKVERERETKLLLSLKEELDVLYDQIKTGRLVARIGSGGKKL